MDVPCHLDPAVVHFHWVFPVHQVSKHHLFPCSSLFGLRQEVPKRPEGEAQTVRAQVLDPCSLVVRGLVRMLSGGVEVSFHG